MEPSHSSVPSNFFAFLSWYLSKLDISLTAESFIQQQYSQDSLSVEEAAARFWKEQAADLEREYDDFCIESFAEELKSTEDTTVGSPEVTSGPATEEEPTLSLSVEEEREITDQIVRGSEKFAELEVECDELRAEVRGSRLDSQSKENQMKKVREIEHKQASIEAGSIT